VSKEAGSSMTLLRRAAVLAAVGVLALALGALMSQEASAQQAGEEISLTGVVADFSEELEVTPEPETCAGIPCPKYGLIDEASGKFYGLLSEEDLGAYLGRRVTVRGTVEVEGFAGGPTLVEVSSVHPSSSSSGSATSGTRRDDFLRGSEDDDLLRGGEGDDAIVAKAGADEVVGGPGHDVLYAAYDVPVELAPNAPASPDLLFGGEGDDFIDAADAKGAADAVYCGPGDDLVEVDAEDFIADDCEEIGRR
jgi:RTX calcium-binding nonapeptide repeat (4 copies)